MGRSLRLLCLLFGCLLAFGQDGRSRVPSINEPEVKLPNGKSQRSEMAKADHKNNLKDVEKLAQLANEIKTEVEAGDAFVVSLRTLKKLEEIEKAAKAIRGRWVRY